VSLTASPSRNVSICLIWLKSRYGVRFSLQLGKEEAVLSITMHPIICDDWSLRIFMRELAIHYHAFAAGKLSPLLELPIQYADFVYWQRERLKEVALKEQLAYWKQQLYGASPMLKQPAERGSLMTQTPRGAKRSLTFPKMLVDELKDLSRREGATLFMTLFAAFGQCFITIQDKTIL